MLEKKIQDLREKENFYRKIKRKSSFDKIHQCVLEEFSAEKANNSLTKGVMIVQKEHMRT